MPGNIYLDGLGEIGKQALALGRDAKGAINKALLAGAQVIKTEASQRIPRYARHRTDHGRSSKHLADALVAEVVTDRQVAGVTVEGDFENGPSYYVKFVEYGTTKMSKRQYIQKSGEAKEDAAMEAVAAELKERLGL